MSSNERKFNSVALLFNLLELGIKLLGGFLRYCVSRLFQQSLEAHSCHHFLQVRILIGGFRHIAPTGNHLLHQRTYDFTSFGMGHQGTKAVPDGIAGGVKVRLVKPVGYGTRFPKVISRIGLCNFADQNRISAIAGDCRNRMFTGNGDPEQEFRFPFLGADFFAIHHQGDRGQVRIYLDLRLRLGAVNIPSAADVNELYGFARVALAPGEKKTVCFQLDPSQTAFLTRKREIEWKIEKGEFTVMVGAAADDIRLTGAFRITEDRFIAGKNRKFYTLGEVCAQ